MQRVGGVELDKGAVILLLKLTWIQETCTKHSIACMRIFSPQQKEKPTRIEIGLD
jgi:hypothetical protein